MVFGGRSSEHAVSCSTAASVLAAIDRQAYDVIPVGITPDGRWVTVPDDPEPLRLTPAQTPAVPPGESVLVPLGVGDHELSVLAPGAPPRVLGEVDVVFPLLHGPFGEDGTVQGMLELADIRYVGSGVTASAVMMDKHHMKVLFASAGLPIGPYAVITDRQWRADPQAAMDTLEPLGMPLFVKPARAGSSQGVTKVHHTGELRAAIEAARAHDPKVVVEAAVTGREVECGVLQGHGTDAPRTSPIGEIEVVSGHEFYDFDAKYLDESDVRLSCPAQLPEPAAARIRELAAAAFEAAGCEGLARVDFFYQPDGTVLVNELNTMPGFTPQSMFPRVWATAGVSYRELIDELIALALERRTGLR